MCVTLIKNVFCSFQQSLYIMTYRHTIYCIHTVSEYYTHHYDCTHVCMLYRSNDPHHVRQDQVHVQWSAVWRNQGYH